MATKAEVEGHLRVRNVDSSGDVEAGREARPRRRRHDQRRRARHAATTALSRARLKGSFDKRTIPATWTERRIAAGAENLAYGPPRARSGSTSTSAGTR